MITNDYKDIELEGKICYNMPQFGEKLVKKVITPEVNI